jgi:integrase
LLPACSEYLKPLVLTALNTGFRRSALLSLTWEDIDFDRLTVTVQASYAKNGERRNTPMNDLLHPTLEEVRIKSPGPVFPNQKGVQYCNFRTPFNNAVQKVSIANFTFHDLRHTFANCLGMSGFDLSTVKALMGHKDIKMTLRYTHLSRDDKQNAVKALHNFGTNLRRLSR